MKTKYWIEKGERLQILRVLSHPCVVSEGEQLAWSNENSRVPDIGEMITVRFNDFGEAKVVGYFTEDGYFGLIVEPVKLPDWYVKQTQGKKLVRPLHGWHQICAFGAEIDEVM